MYMYTYTSSVYQGDDDDFDYLDSSRAPCLHRRRVRGGRTGGAHPRRHPGILNTKKRK